MPFDSREYEWADVTLVVAGLDIDGIRGVKYTEKIEQEPLHAKGRRPRSIQRGNITYEGEFTMLQSSYLRLRRAGGGSLLGLRPVSECSYGNPSLGDALVTDRMTGIAFGEGTQELKQGDKFMEVTVPFIFTDLIPDV